MQPAEFVEGSTCPVGAGLVRASRKVPGTFEGEWQIYQPQNVPRRGSRINMR